MLLMLLLLLLSLAGEQGRTWLHHRHVQRPDRGRHRRSGGRRQDCGHRRARGLLQAADRERESVQVHLQDGRVSRMNPLLINKYQCIKSLP